MIMPTVDLPVRLLALLHPSARRSCLIDRSSPFGLPPLVARKATAGCFRSRSGIPPETTMVLSRDYQTASLRGGVNER